MDWYNGLHERYPDESFVSPGGVSMFAPVSRAAVYLRINSGKLTAFCYHPTKFTKTLFGGLRKSRKSAYVLIPVSECKAWGERLRQRYKDDDMPRKNEKFDMQREQERITDWPKHKGKTSPPKWKKKISRKPSILGLLGALLCGFMNMQVIELFGRGGGQG